MSARWLTSTAWVIPQPMAAVMEWVASRWARDPARPGGLRAELVDAGPRATQIVPSGPHPHASARLSLWNQVELFSRM